MTKVANNYKFCNAMEARLQTATSSGAVYSIISVHKLDDFIVPKFFDLIFHWQHPYIT